MGTKGTESTARRPWGRGLIGVALTFLVAVAVAAPRVTARNAGVLQGERAPTLAECLQRIHVPCLGPAQVRAAYGVDALLRRGITGKGRTIAIIVSFGSPTIRSDLQAFDRAFGLPDPPRLDILAPLGMRHPASTGWVGETTLDVEWAHAIAPQARLVVLESPVDETEGTQGMPEFLALERYAVSHHLADVLSQSWSATEETLFDKAGRAIVAQFHQFYADAARRGITAVTGSGDEGAGGYDLSVRRLYPYPAVGYPASDPLVLAVGGTRLLLNQGGSLTGETTWPGSGGGVSKFFAEPAYQKGQPAAIQRLLHGKRGIPDVAYNAALESPVLVYQGGHWSLTGGTSAGTPQWAGLIALADTLAGRDLGSVNAALYRLAASPRYRSDLRDITTGAISAPARDGNGVHGIAFRAGVGWDAATGLGSPRAATLIPDLVRASR